MRARAATSTENTGQVFECWAAISLAADVTETNQLRRVDNCVLLTDKGPISLRHLEFHDRTLYLLFFIYFNTYCI